MGEQTLTVRLLAAVFFYSGMVGATLIDRLTPPPRSARSQTVRGLALTLAVAAPLALDAKAFADLSA